MKSLRLENADKQKKESMFGYLWISTDIFDVSINIFDTSKNIFNMSANIFDISTDISKYPRVLGFTLTSSIVLQMRILPTFVFGVDIFSTSVDISGYLQISNT